MNGRMYVLWVGIGGGLFRGRDNRLCFLWYSIGLGVGVLWVSMFDVFWVLFGVVVLGGGVFFCMLCLTSWIPFQNF